MTPAGWQDFMRYPRKLPFAFSGLVISLWTLPTFQKPGYEPAWSLSTKDCKAPPLLISSQVTAFPRCTIHPPGGLQTLLKYILQSPPRKPKYSDSKLNRADFSSFLFKAFLASETQNNRCSYLLLQ